MKTTFNLNNFNKLAFYENGKDVMQKQSRAFNNCVKAKREKKMSAHEAWESCLKEFQDSGNGEWAKKYAD